MIRAGPDRGRISSQRGSHAATYHPFGFQSTAADVAHGVDLTASRSSSQAVRPGSAWKPRALAIAGAEITPAVRRPGAAGPVAEELSQAIGNRAIGVRQLDLSDLGARFRGWLGWPAPRPHQQCRHHGRAGLERTPQGFELQFGTNYLGHFALALGLHRHLAAANGARVVSVSSSGPTFSPVIFDDFGFDFVP